MEVRELFLCAVKVKGLAQRAVTSLQAFQTGTVSSQVIKGLLKNRGALRTTAFRRSQMAQLPRFQYALDKRLLCPTGLH